MLFYAGKVIQHPAMQNPTLVVLTDRNDLDDQLLDNTFAPGHELLRQVPVQAAEPRRPARQAARGVRRRRLHHHPEVHARRRRGHQPGPLRAAQHRLHRGRGPPHPVRLRGPLPAARTRASQKVYGLAKYMRDALPNATFIGFTGTPVSAQDRSTRNVFGEYIDVYDIQRAVDDKATVPIYYEARYAKMKLDEALVPRIDPQFEEVTEGEEASSIKTRCRASGPQIAAIVGDPDRIELVAQDIVDHFEQRDRPCPARARP